MLAAGYTSLATLKARIMPDAGDEETEWDAKLTSLALGVAYRFDIYTARTLERGTAVVDEFTARATAWTLLRYPVESLDGITLVDRDGSTSSVPTTDALLNARSGTVEIPHFIGSPDQRVRFTYDGGYWLDDGGSQPAGSTALPKDLLEAWYFQVQHLAEAQGIFGDAGMRETGSRMDDLDLVPMVRETLNRYRRFGGE